MSGFVVLSRDAIRKWLAGLIAHGTTGGVREGPTLNVIGQYMGIDRNTMLWLARKDSARMSMHRQMHFSKVIAMIENGQLDFVVKGNKKVAVVRDKPVPIKRYQPVFGAKGPTLKALDRPPPYTPMMTFKGLLGK